MSNPENNNILVPESKQEEAKEGDFSSKLYAYLPMAIYELVGIFFFVTIITFTGADINKFIFGFWVILTIFGSYSGGHVNPAITFGFYIYDAEWGFGLIKLVLYWIAQFVGATLGAEFSYFITHKRIFVAVPHQSSGFEVFLAEFMFTGTFLFVILFVCSKITQPAFANGPTKTGVIVGWFYTAVQTGAGLSGAAYNPAILFALNGFAFFGGNRDALNMVFKMMGAELAGALAFALFFKYIFERNYPDQNEKKN